MKYVTGEDAVDRVLLAGLRHFRVTRREITSPEKHRAIADVRFVIMYAMRMFVRPTPSFPTIAHVFGRDHSTAVSAIRRVEERVQAEDARTLKDLGEMKLLLGIAEGE